MRDAVVSLFLIEKNQSTGDWMREVCRVSQDGPDDLGHIRSLSILHEAGLVGSDQVRKNESETISKHP